MIKRSSTTIQERILKAVLYAFFVGGATAQPLGSFIPFLRNAYGFHYQVTGILLSCQSLGFLLALGLSGIMPYVIGQRKSILLTSIWMAVAYLIFVGKNVTSSILAVAFFMTGIARGGNTIFSNTTVSSLPGEITARAFNMLHGSYAVGALLSPLLLVFFTGLCQEMGWRVVAGLLLLLSLSQILTYARMPLPMEAKLGLSKTDVAFLKNGVFWLSTAMLFFYLSAEHAILGWLVTYFQDTGILNADKSQMMNSLLWASILCGRLLGTKLSENVNSAKLLLFDSIGMLVFLLVMLTSRTSLLVTIGLMGMGLSMATVYPSVLNISSYVIHGNDMGNSVLILSGSAGGVLTPILVGAVAEKAGIRVGMSVIVILTGLLLLSTVYCFLKLRTYHLKPEIGGK